MQRKSMFYKRDERRIHDGQPNINPEKFGMNECCYPSEDSVGSVNRKT